MFTADLSWTDAGAEKVGERKERIARERSLYSPSVYSYRSSSRASSTADERELWWTSGFRKAKSLTPMRQVKPSTSRSAVTGISQSRRTSSSLRFITSSLDQESQDPPPNPDLTYASTLPPNLTAGELLDLSNLDFDASGSEGDRSSRGTTSSGSLSSREHSWAPRSAPTPEIVEIQPQTPRSITIRSPARNPEPEPAPTWADLQHLFPSNSQKKRNRATRIGGDVDLSSLQLPCMPEVNLAITPPTPPGSTASSHSSGFASARLVPWVPPPDWQVLQPRRSVKPMAPLKFMDAFEPRQVRKSREEPEERKTHKDFEAQSEIPEHEDGIESTTVIQSQPVETPTQLSIEESVPIQTQAPSNPSASPPVEPPVLNGIAVAHNSLLELTRYQRFIRRMENAGPKVILHRLKEEWVETSDDETNEELHLEKRLWLLTAFQVQKIDNVRPQPKCDTGKILEMYGNLAEVYQLSAMYPRQKVQYLMTSPHRPMPLPGNVSYTTVPQVGLIPCPWPDATFSHIRTSTLPSLVQSSKLPQLLRECHRLLAPGGLLEVRIMDAAPVRNTTGPLFRGWIEDRLAINLEKTFRCSKPCMLVPGWVDDAGFEMASSDGGQQIMKMPCAYDEASCDVDAELKMLVGRALWKDIWGAYVEDVAGEPQDWWEVDEIVDECLERGTIFECGTIFAYKK